MWILVQSRQEGAAVEFLKRLGSSINGDGLRSRKSVLQRAAESDDTGAVEFLLANGAQPFRGAFLAAGSGYTVTG